MQNVIICNVILVVNNKTETVFVVVNKRTNEPYNNCWELPSSNFLFNEQVDTFSMNIIKNKLGVKTKGVESGQFFLDYFENNLYIIYKYNMEYSIIKQNGVKMLPLLQVLNLNMAFNHKRYIRDTIGGF